jgi:hypothetical protein
MMVIKKLGVEKAKRLDWDNPRIICVAESYSKFDIDTLEVIPLKLELYRYHYYENDIFTLEKVNSDEEKSIPAIQSTMITQIDTIERKIVEHNLDIHLNKGQPQVKELFFLLQSRIFELDENIQERITSVYIGYKVSNLFAEVHMQKMEYQFI